MVIKIARRVTIAPTMKFAIKVQTKPAMTNIKRLQDQTVWLLERVIIIAAPNTMVTLPIIPQIFGNIGDSSREKESSISCLTASSRDIFSRDSSALAFKIPPTI